jgi:hypothetical protein
MAITYSLTRQTQSEVIVNFEDDVQYRYHRYDDEYGVTDAVVCVREYKDGIMFETRIENFGGDKKVTITQRAISRHADLKALLEEDEWRSIDAYRYNRVRDRIIGMIASRNLDIHCDDEKNWL